MKCNNTFIDRFSKHTLFKKIGDTSSWAVFSLILGIFCQGFSFYTGPNQAAVLLSHEITANTHYPKGLSLSGVEAPHIKEEIKEKMALHYSHVTHSVVSANDSCGAVFTAFKSGTFHRVHSIVCVPLCVPSCVLSFAFHCVDQRAFHDELLSAQHQM